MINAVSDFIAKFKSKNKPVSDQMAGIQKTARDYALEIHGTMSDLPAGISKEEIFDCLMRMVHPGKHIHCNPVKKQKHQQTETQYETGL